MYTYLYTLAKYNSVPVSHFWEDSYIGLSLLEKHDTHAHVTPNKRFIFLLVQQGRSLELAGSDLKPQISCHH